MKAFLSGLAAVLLLSTGALAAPVAPQTLQLSDSQMDGVTAGWTYQEELVSNTSWTQIRVYQSPNNVLCSTCYISISSPQLSIGSAFGQLPF